MPRWIAFNMNYLEYFFFKHSYWSHWRRLGLDPEYPPQPACASIEITTSNEKQITISTQISVNNSKQTRIFRTTVVYTFCCDGSVKISSTVSPEIPLSRLSSLPRIGFSFALRKNLSSISYSGRGPHESYQDRKTSSEFGIWSTTPNSMGYRYIVPCENGNRSNCNWVLFRRPCLTRHKQISENTFIPNYRKQALVIVAAKEGNEQENTISPDFHFSALLHNQIELHHATHTHQLDDRQDGAHPIFCSIDSHQMGLGGDVGWSPCVYDDFLLRPNETYTSR